jgi:hypothetical protein
MSFEINGFESVRQRTQGMQYRQDLGDGSNYTSASKIEQLSKPVDKFQSMRQRTQEIQYRQDLGDCASKEEQLRKPIDAFQSLRQRAQQEPTDQEALKANFVYLLDSQEFRNRPEDAESGNLPVESNSFIGSGQVRFSEPFTCRDETKRRNSAYEISSLVNSLYRSSVSARTP